MSGEMVPDDKEKKPPGQKGIVSTILADHVGPGDFD
jgi:hypothetical protein